MEIVKDALYDEDDDDDIFIIPKAETSGAVVGQTSSYHDEWASFMESAKESDEWDIHNFVVANTSAEPAEALQRLLPVFRGCPSLFSKRFQLELGEGGQVLTVVEVL